MFVALLPPMLKGGIEGVLETAVEQMRAVADELRGVTLRTQAAGNVIRPAARDGLPRVVRPTEHSGGHVRAMGNGGEAGGVEPLDGCGMRFGKRIKTRSAHRPTRMIGEIVITKRIGDEQNYVLHRRLTTSACGNAKECHANPPLSHLAGAGRISLSTTTGLWREGILPSLRAVRRASSRRKEASALVGAEPWWGRGPLGARASCPRSRRQARMANAPSNRCALRRIARARCPRPQGLDSLTLRCCTQPRTVGRPPADRPSSSFPRRTPCPDR